MEMMIMGVQLLLHCMQLLTLPLASMCFDPHCTSMWDIAWYATNIYTNKQTYSTHTHTELWNTFLIYVELQITLPPSECIHTTPRCTVQILYSVCAGIWNRHYTSLLKHGFMHHSCISHSIFNKPRRNILKYKWQSLNNDASLPED